MNRYGRKLAGCLAGFLAMLGAGLAVLLGACSDQHDPPPPYDANRARRLFRPPEGEVRAVPPHAIHDRGVGPYTLGASLRSILGLLPGGPRVMLVQIDGVLDYSLVRAEADSLLIGVEPAAGVTFLSVLDHATARLESGVGVGTSAEALRKDLGPELIEPERAMDARILAFANMPSMRFLLDREDGRVIAVVVRRDDAGFASRSAPAPGPGAVPGAVPVPDDDAPDTPAARRASPASQAASARPPAAAPGTESIPGREVGTGTGCPAKPRTESDEELIRVASATEPGARAAPAAAAEVRHGCFSALVPEALVIGKGMLTVVGGEPDKLRKLASLPVPDLVYAAPLDVDRDGRSEIAVVSQRVSPEERVVSVELQRLDNGRWQRLAGQDVYRVSATNAAWVGARLNELELLVELHGEAEVLHVSGLYVHRGEARPELVAPLMRIAVPIRRSKRPGPGSLPAAVPGPGSLTTPAGAGDQAGRLDPAAEVGEPGETGHGTAAPAGEPMGESSAAEASPDWP